MKAIGPITIFVGILGFTSQGVCEPTINIDNKSSNSIKFEVVRRCQPDEKKQVAVEGMISPNGGEARELPRREQQELNCRAHVEFKVLGDLPQSFRDEDNQYKQAKECRTSDIMLPGRSASSSPEQEKDLNATLKIADGRTTCNLRKDS